MSRTMDGTIRKTDCLAGMAKLPAGSVDLVFADPPFNIGYDYDVYHDRQDAESYLDWSRKWISLVYRVLKPDGTFWLAIGDEYAAELKVLSQDVGFTTRSWVIWYYTFGVNCTQKFSRSHAHLFHFIKDPENFTFNSEAIRVPSARQLVYADARANPNGRLPDDTWILRPQDCVDGFTADEDTWYFPRVAGTFKERAGFHGCQMPEQLLGRIIRSCSNDGELVLDPFSGSATTLVVAKKLGRRWLGFEISADYVKRGKARLESAQVGDPLDGAPEPLASAPRTPLEVPTSKSKTQLRQSAVARTTWEPTIDERGVIDAFRQTHNGFSVDRVVADALLDAAFLDRCNQLGLEGTAADLNRTLFRLRKAGRLMGIPTTRRTEFTWAEYDECIDASEIALRQTMDAGAESLDEVLCDPELAQQFDEIAESFAPGLAALRYRWAALKLRKLARSACRSSHSVDPIKKLSKAVPIEDIKSAQMHADPGVYLIYQGQRRVLYSGVALDLRMRIHDRFDRSRWAEMGSAIRVRFAHPAINVERDGKINRLFAYQCQLVTRHNPQFNFEKLQHVAT